MKTIVLVPVVSGDGSKFMTTALANAYKDSNRDKKVAIVDFDVKNPYLASALSNDNIHGIDNLIEKIDGDILTEKLFMENMIKLKNGVSLLKGTQFVNAYEMFEKKHAEKILFYLESLYDVVFISVSNEFDNYLSVCSLMKADEVLMISQNNQGNLKSFERVSKEIKNYSSKAGVKSIINKYTETSKVDISQVSKKCGVEVVGTIDYDENAIDNVNINAPVLGGFFKKQKRNEESFKEILSKLIK